MSLSPSQLISVMSGSPEREGEREGGEMDGVVNIIFYGPSLHPLLEQRDRDEITPLHRLLRDDHVLPAHTSGSAHVVLMLRPASSVR